MLASFKNQTILVLGGGLSGKAVIQFLYKQKPNYIILADKSQKSPLANLNIQDNQNYLIKEIDCIIKSPGINPNHPILQNAKKKNIRITTEVEIANQIFLGKKIGVTGTDGKSTTTALIHHFLSSAKLKCEMGGNIGKPFLEFAQQDYDLVTLELSSYQLEDSQNLNLDISVFLNLTYDHLERHKTLKNYRNAKFKIVNLHDKHHIFITNEILKSIFLEKYKIYQGRILTFGTKKSDAYLEDKKTLKVQEELFDISKFSLSGHHNIENLMAAILACKSIGVESKKIQENLSSFKGLSYRFELLGEKKGITFINDSKATNLNSMLAGIQNENLDEVILILGGQIKNEPFEPLINRLKQSNSTLVYLFGEVTKKWQKPLKHILEKNLIICKNLEEVFNSLQQKIRERQIQKVIFSPACPSFDQYENFEKRGEHFSKLYSNLI